MTLAAVPSADPTDLKLNAENFDKFMNSTDPTFDDRLNISRQTIAGAYTNIAADTAAVDAARITAQADIAADVTAVEVNKNLGISSIGTYVAAVNDRKDQALVVDIPNAINTLLAINNRGEWAPSTAYTTAKQIVSVTTTSGAGTQVVWYICVVAHTSSTVLAGGFLTDRDSKWRVYQNLNPEIEVTLGTVEADLMSDVNVNVPNPTLVGGVFVVDGEQVTDGLVVHLGNQTNDVQSGPWMYTSGTNTLSRPPEYYPGLVIGKPFQVNIATGDDYGGTSQILDSPSTAIVGTDAIFWVDSSSDASAVSNGTALFGPPTASKLSAIPTQRRIDTRDLPPWRPNAEVFPRWLFEEIAPFGLVSRYIDPTNPWSNVVALQNCIRENNVVYFDRPITLNSQQTQSLRRKLFIFMGRQAPITIASLTSSFLDLTGAVDFEMAGSCILEWVAPTGGSIKAIKGTSFTNVKIERLRTKNVTNAIHVDGTINGFRIGTVGVNDLATETAFTIDSASAAGSVKTNLRLIEDKPVFGAMTLNASYTYRAWRDPDTLVINDAMTANRTITMSLQNATEGKSVSIRHAATGGFSIVINDSAAVALKTIASGQSAELVMSGGLWYLKS
jgi:hypothetical protein